MQNLYVALLMTTLAVTGMRFMAVRHPDETAVLGCIAVVVLNWIANTGWVISSGDTDAVLMFMATDLISLLTVRLFGGQLSGALATTYAGQIALHVMHLAGAGDPLFYWQLLTAVGYLQFAILLAWALLPAPSREIEDWL